MQSRQSERDRLLARILLPRLGYASQTWPAQLELTLERLARERAVTTLELLEVLERHPDAQVIRELVDAATIGYTRFFRHSEQFERLGSELYRSALSGRMVEIWCAACSTGEEAWSLAMICERVGVRYHIVASDVNERALEVAARAEYARAVGGRASFAIPSQWSAPASMRNNVEFHRASLLDPRASSLLGTEFDYVFCRNALIYFERSDAVRVLGVLARSVRSGGYLVVSPVEALLASTSELTHEAPLGWLRPRSVQTSSLQPVPVRLALNAPEPSAGALEQAAVALGRRDWDAAEVHLREALSRDADHAEAWFLLGETLLARGERTQARAAYEKVLVCSHTSTHGEALRNAALRQIAKREEDDK